MSIAACRRSWAGVNLIEDATIGKVFFAHFLPAAKGFFLGEQLHFRQLGGVLGHEFFMAGAVKMLACQILRLIAVDVFQISRVPRYACLCGRRFLSTKATGGLAKIDKEGLTITTQFRSSFSSRCASFSQEMNTSPCCAAQKSPTSRVPRCPAPACFYRIWPQRLGLWHRCRIGVWRTP